MGLAYLFARAADTIADTDQIDISKRQHCLDILKAQFETPGRSPQDLISIHNALNFDKTIEADIILLTRLHECFALFQTLPKDDQNKINTLMLTLINGMKMDITIFPPPSSSQITALPTLETLDLYTYHVAGCVGEFWTNLSTAHIPSLHQWDIEKMSARGIRFGKGLQLTNILKDISSDLRKGRCYIPNSLLQQYKLSPKDLLTRDGFRASRPILNDLINLAIDHLEAGWEYTLEIPRNCIRLRLGCLWPILLAIKTLRHTANSIDEYDPNITPKITKREVYAAIIFSSIAVTSNTVLTKYYRHQSNIVFKSS